MAQDRFKQAIQALAEDANRQYYGLYPYKVKETLMLAGVPHLGLEPEIEGLPQMVRVPWLMPMAQYVFETAQLGMDETTGTRLLVGFIAGDPSRPVALPFFLSGMVGTVTETTYGTYEQKTEEHTTRITAPGTDAAKGNINELALADGTGAAGGNINMNAEARGSSSSGGNINMTAASSGTSTTGGNIRAQARGEIRLRTSAGVVTISTQNGAINITATGGNVNITASGNVVMNNGGRNVAREGDTIELTSFSGTVADPLSGPLSVTMTNAVGRITSGTNRVKVP